MVIYYYGAFFALSLVLLIAYAWSWHKHFDVSFTIVFTLIPIVNLGYFLLSISKNLEAALIANSITYIGGCYLEMIVMLCALRLCNFGLKDSMVAGLLTLCSIIYISMLMPVSTGIFYKSVSYENVNGVVHLSKEYGPMHRLFYILLIVFFLVGFLTPLYSYFRKKDVSRKTIWLLFLPNIVCFISFFGGRALTKNIELMPFAYVFTQVIYFIIVHRVCLYDITDTGIDSLVETGDTGFVSFDFHFNYLGSNETAKNILPELRNMRVDSPVDSCWELKNTALLWLTAFKEDEKNDKFHFSHGDKTYLVDTNYLYDGHTKRGYQFFITDDTKDQQYIALLNSFNENLKNEVAEKTAGIEEMHNKLILGMAAMVESRDNSTGGHIKRTSEVVRMLIEEMTKENELNLSEEFCRDIIKAAPMHDLGKIAVDDAVLRKPGRFTPEEFEEMKKHAAEGARIVHTILEGTDDSYFHQIAENVAHYHHERVDGSGYPEHLKGNDIPLEARIMAIADVNDALVSKRVYKERMSFEQADRIIMEGMGTQFDERLMPYYVSARPRFEEYYRALDD